MDRYILCVTDFLTIEAETLPEVSDILTQRATQMKTMLETGKVELEDGLDVCCAVLLTSDKEVADQFGFELENLDDDDLVDPDEFEDEDGDDGQDDEDDELVGAN